MNTPSTQPPKVAPARDAARVVFLLARALGVSSLAAGCGRSNSESEAPSAATAADSAHAAGKGQVVVLDSAGIRLGGIAIGVAEGSTNATLAVTGAITYDANRVTHVGARTEGRVLTVNADLGSAVRRGQMLAELESAEVGQIRAEERRDEALAGIARENFEREKRLEQQGISSRKELLEAEADLRRVEAELQSARDRLSVMGAGHGTGGHFDIVSPFDGVIVARRIGRGQTASSTDSLFTVADLSRLWIELDIFERDLARVRVGQGVQVSTEAYGGRRFPGRIVNLGDVLDPQKRTVRARVEIANADRVLKPGMFATARIEVGGTGPALAVVPQNAVQDMGGRQVVFVPGDRPGEFQVREVVIGETLEGNLTVIRSGLVPGDRLVVAGAFALRSELAKAEIGEAEH